MLVSEINSVLTKKLNEFEAAQQARVSHSISNKIFNFMQGVIKAGSFTMAITSIPLFVESIAYWNSASLRTLVKVQEAFLQQVKDNPMGWKVNGKSASAVCKQAENFFNFVIHKMSLLAPSGVVHAQSTSDTVGALVCGQVGLRFIEQDPSETCEMVEKLSANISKQLSSVSYIPDAVSNSMKFLFNLINNFACNRTSDPSQNYMNLSVNYGVVAGSILVCSIALLCLGKAARDCSEKCDVKNRIAFLTQQI